MAVVLLGGQVTWKGEQDEDGHRDYEVVHKVQAGKEDGPYLVMTCPGLPEEGQAWNFDNDVDELAWCKFQRKVEPVVSGEANELWLVTSYFSTRPVDKCREEPQLDPLLEPYKLSVGVNKYTEEAAYDVDGKKITNSAFEVIRGPQNEWDASRAVVKITQNVPDPEANLLISMLDTVNDDDMWRFPPRSVKYSNFSLERKYHGSCEVYYTRTLEFDIRPEGFDRHILDEGTKVLNGEWNSTTRAWDLININGFPPNPLNPNHFTRATDPHGNPIRMILDGHGKPWTPNADETLYWWCVDNGVEPFVENNTCSGVTDTAWYWNANLKGPFDSEVDAEVACDDPNQETAVWPGDLLCPEDPNQPGRIYVRKYRGANFFSLFAPNLPSVIE